MYEADFVCDCGFRFKERFSETEVVQESDLQNFYVRCPRCGEEALPRSLQPASQGLWRRRDDS